MVVAHEPQFGLPLGLLDFLAPAMTSYWAVTGVTWAVIAIQVVIAATIFGSPQHRVIALGLGVVLHLGIALMMSLPVFGAIVIGVLIIAAASDRPQSVVHEGV